MNGLVLYLKYLTCCPVLENIRRYFRYYLALILAALLALGTRLAPAAALPGAPENFGTASK